MTFAKMRRPQFTIQEIYLNCRRTRSALRHFSYTPRHYGNAAISEQI